MSKIATFFGLADANDKILRLGKTLAVLLPVVSATITISSTFFMIFIAEALGHGSFIDGMGLIGILVVIQMLIQTLLDYPTGALGDWIGQRYVISSAFLSFGVSFYLVSLVTFETPFWFLVMIYVLMGFGNSQLSGSFNAWFDNNYRVAMPGDSDRKQYGIFWGKVGMLFQIVATLALIPGSILAVLTSRAYVFQIQAVLCVVIAVIVMRLIRDFPEVEETRQEKPSLGEYTSLLKSGVSFLFSDKFVMYVILGGTLMMSTMSVWGQLLLFPMYFSYLLTDVAVSSFRTILFVPGIVSSERSGVWSRRFDSKKWIPRFRIMQSCGFIFYMAFAFIMTVFPPVTTGVMVTVLLPFTSVVLMELPFSNILPIILITITFVATSFFGGFAEILTQRELLDVIPNRIRNSMYSLSPTISTILAIPQIALFGWLIPIAGFPITLASVGIIAFFGAVMIRKGLSYPKPIAKPGTDETSTISVAVPED
ncbi:MAG: MFS transporter [Candidatus Thorarchaeota archaeon]